MSDYSGYLFIIDEPRRAQVVEDYICGSGTFTDTISAPDWRAGHAEIFFISLTEDAFHYAALVRRGRRRIATQKHRVRFSNFVHFEPAIPLQQIEESLRPGIRQHFIRASSGTGSRVPPRTWQDFLALVKMLRPRSAHKLDELEKLLQQHEPKRIRGHGLRIVAQERDAVNFALRTSGFDHRSILSDWHLTGNDQLAPFLQGLNKAALREDQMIAHDAEVFGDWTRLGRNQVGAVRFQKRAEQLTVINVNRHKVEETLGVDLIYYHHRYESYVMVQYKRMVQESGEAVYRPIDRSYQAELERMQSFESALSSLRQFPPSIPTEFRLHPGAFYLKLCPVETLEPASAEMISGMYIPLGYWKILTTHPSTQGQRGGRLVTFKNAGRYFNNTLFIDLVKAGWIGSKVSQTEVITDIVQHALEGSKSVILASLRASTESHAQQMALPGCEPQIPF